MTVVLEPTRPDILETTLIRRIGYRPIRVTPKTLWSFIEVETADGLCGIGEATFFRGAHDFPKVTSQFSAQLVGKPLMAIEDKALWPQESDTTGWAVLSALEQASLDLCGQMIGAPVSALLGPALHDKIPLYANINRRTTDRAPAGFIASVQKARKDGFTKFKIAPFDGIEPGATPDAALFEAGTSRIRAAHAAMEGQGTLMVDCHWRLDLDHALKVLDLAVELGLGWIECPVPETPETLADLRVFKARCGVAGIAVAGGEQGTCQAYFERILGEGVYDIIMPDVKYVGGIKQLVQLAKLAQAHDVQFAPHNPSGPVAHLASLHAMRVTPNLAMLEHQYDEDPLFWTLNAHPMPQIAQALSDLPLGDGLGFSTANFPD
jgi:galactonate dehydratase